MGTNTDLYTTDFYTWIQQQAALLKARQFDALDLDNLIDEVEGLARQERRFLAHRLETLLTHLVAWWGHIPERCVRWQHTIAVQRYELQDILTDSPSLGAHVSGELAEVWAWVRERSQQEWPNAQFPEDCPWTLAQLLDADFWPAPETFPARTKEDRDAAVSTLDTHRC